MAERTAIFERAGYIGSPRSLALLAVTIFTVTALSGVSQPLTALWAGVPLPGRLADLGFPLVFAVIVLAAAAQSATVLLAGRAPMLALTASLGVQLAAVYSLGAPKWVEGGLFAIGAVLLVLAAQHRPRVALGAGVLVCLGYAVGLVPLLQAQDGDLRWPTVAVYLLPVGVALAAYCALPAALGAWMGHVARRELASQRAQDARVSSARDAERARVAQELHDVTGHHLLGLAALAEAAAETADSAPTVAAELLQDIRAETRFAVASLYGALGDLKGSPVEVPPTLMLHDLAAIADRARATGQDLTLTVTGEVGRVPAAASVTAVRVVQESLTNARKHARGAAVQVAVAVDPLSVSVSVRNAPPPARVPALMGHGLGLAGMRERLALLDGTFEAGEDLDGGWSIAALIPLAAAEDGARDYATPSDRMVF